MTSSDSSPFLSITEKLFPKSLKQDPNNPVCEVLIKAVFVVRQVLLRE